MKTEIDLDENKWLSIIGKSLAYVCLHLADLKDEGLTQQADFLKKLGLSREDSAGLLGTTEETLRVAEHRSKSKKGKKVEKTKKRRRQTR